MDDSVDPQAFVKALGLVREAIWALTQRPCSCSDGTCLGCRAALAVERAEDVLRVAASETE